MLDDLRSALQGTRGSYCFGGSVRMIPSEGGRERIAGTPVSLRFDTSQSSASKIQFPLSSDGSSLEILLRACSPPSSGSSGRDETVGVLDASHFSTDFHPYDHGIIDTIAQILLPGVKDPIQDESFKGREEHWGLRAELKALTVSESSSFAKA
jgi:hypothetical protein